MQFNDLEIKLFSDPVEVLCTRLSGETTWEAIINSKGLDIEEEADFIEFLRLNNVPLCATLEILEVWFSEWEKVKK